MPKGKRKGKSDRGRNEASMQTSDDDSYNNYDNYSITSNSETRSLDDCGGGGGAGAEENGDDYLQDQFEDKLIEVIDGLGQKSSQGRTNCIQSLSRALIKRYVPNFVKERHYTICDSIERCLKKGGNLEKSAAAELAPIVCVQLGDEDAGEIVDKALRPLMITAACDGTFALSVRAKCCAAVGMIGFICGTGDPGDIILLMQQLESIFSGSYLKGDGTVPNITPELATLHAAALSAWTLLLTGLSPGMVTDLIENRTLPSLDQLSELLDSQHLDIRLCAGEAIALIIEEGRKEQGDFGDDFALCIGETLKQLATDSHKYRAKKDRKQQRATFRDILQFIEDDLVPDVQVKFGKESLNIDTWTRRKQYDAMCNMLGPGINVHLAENDYLRDVFEIGEMMQPTQLPLNRQSQLERYRKRLVNAANFKARSIARGKNRDKRSDF